MLLLFSGKKKHGEDAVTQGGGESKSSTKDSEHESLLEKNESRDQQVVEIEQGDSLENKETEKKEKPGQSCQREEDTEQEQNGTQKESNNSSVQRIGEMEEQGGVRTMSQPMCDKSHDERTEEETMDDTNNTDKDTKTKSVSEVTGAEEREEDREQPRNGNEETRQMENDKSDNGVSDGKSSMTEQQQAANEGEETNGHNQADEEEQTSSLSIETTAVETIDEKAQLNDPSPREETNDVHSDTEPTETPTTDGDTGKNDDKNTTAHSVDDELKNPPEK